MQRISALLIIMVLTAISQAAPAPGTFSILPIFDWITTMRDTSANASRLQAEMDRLRSQIGENGGRFRVGFAHVLGSEAGLRLHCRLAQQNHLSVGVIIAVQTHSGFGKDIVLHDLRCAQWRLDGKTWAGQSADKNDPVEFPARDWRVPTPSRYCMAIHDKAITIAGNDARAIRRAMDSYPGIIVVVNAAIEEELATGGEKRDGLLADYSPFAITEFRDWLRHTGKYDDTSGEYAGQGAPAEIVGPLISIRGAMRPQFYDDPTPANANATGKSFNQWFGTNFLTWNLRSWDLDRFPAPIRNPKFNPMPTRGTGFIAGGFDAPRRRDPANHYWCAWSWDIADHGGQYPPGNPKHPAFGFRQVEIKHFVSDVLDAARKAGIPTNLLYAHQIPGELVEPARLRSGADPIWTGYYEPAGTLGITRFGPIDVQRITQYTRNWGIFEWHPHPFLGANDPALYKATIDALDLYYKNGARILFPGWWHPDAASRKIFPLDDSQFARAIHDWLANQESH